MEVRRATVEDAGGLARGMAAVADEGRWLATPAGTPADALADRFVAAIEAGHVLLALEENGQLVGCLGLHPVQADGVLDLGMWVLSHARGRGGGRALVLAALDHAQATGAHKVQLEVFPTTAAPSPSTRASASRSRACGAATTGARAARWPRP